MSPKPSHVTGEKEVQANIQRLIKDNWKDAKKALRQEATVIMQKSVPQTPVEFGPLRGSETIEETKETKTEYEITMGYNMKYAAAVHENLNARHAPGTNAKYLEKPLMEQAPKIAKNVATRVKRGMRL